MMVCLSADVDDVVVHFPVKKNRHSLLLGKGAKTLKRVGADSGARIYIPPENELENSTITVSGTTCLLSKSLWSVHQ